MIRRPARRSSILPSSRCSTRRRTNRAPARGGGVSDHISGPRALAEPISDITDVYAFPSPERSGHLVLVLNSLPFAQPSARFSDGLVYRFRLRPVTAAAGDNPALFVVGAE